MGVELAHEIDSACAADKENAFFLGVDIQQRLSREMVRLEGMGSIHAGLFACRDEKLERRVGDVRAVQYGQAVRYCDAVVRTECRAVRPQRVSLDLQGYRVLGKIVAGPLGLLADHVHMPLDLS